MKNKHSPEALRLKAKLLRLQAGQYEQLASNIGSADMVKQALNKLLRVARSITKEKL